ncbi:hypothetical protein [Methylovulum sp.]|uniref:hypothetical protein n=1 Tax=Methylovulum sp. TaxID=1916980 RepID=UPI002634356B|nr:hypothetical protein [Methylovulum sp.]MDD5125380.1 hypothetical protein [Methylovulum sp.]
MKTTIPLHELILKAAKIEKNEVSSSQSEPEPDLSLDLAEHQLFYQVETLKQQLKEAKDTHKLRLGYADKIFWLVCSWLIGVVIAVFMSGLNAFGFSLSDNVLIAFITSTTVNVVGLFFVVAKWMFPNNHKSKNS